ncbi:MAG: hypothetical protein WC723_04125 [Candidatus Omnitrophota bacterium]
MDKKDIYEHLAKIYLDASSKKKKARNYPKFSKNLILVSAVFVFASSLILFNNSQRKKALNSELALVLLPEAAKLNFHFDPARKETYSFNLNKLSLSRFKSLAFSVKKTDHRNAVSLRVEFTTPFKERSEVYFKDIPYKWHDFRINLSEFKGISDWSEISSLSFSVEEWNAQSKKGIVYIDNVRLLK